MTFGIVTFMRPDRLERLIQSIRQFYSDANILIADNGRKLPREVKGGNGVVTWELPFDCGLSASRNFLLHNTEDDVLILDDDFEFTESTRIELLQDVLKHDEFVGVVGGSAGVMNPQLWDGDELEWRETENGTRYCYCDVCDNVLLVRRQAIQEGLCWNPELKVGEHRDFFERLKQSKWKFAHVPDVQVLHHSGGSDEYVGYRQRGSRLNELMREGIVPPVVVFGVGHSGTSIVVRMLEQLGWHLGDVKERVAENIEVQQINKRILSRQGICPCGSDDVVFDAGEIDCRKCSRRSPVGSDVDDSEMADALANLPQPWCIKDPRMVLTLDRWMGELSRYQPLLLHVERDTERMRQTYRKYGFGDFRIYGHTVQELQQIARFKFREWAGERKLSLRYEQVAAAVRLFDLGKA